MSNKTTNVAERMYATTIEQGIEVQELIFASEILIDKGADRFSVADRYKDSKAGDNLVEVSQHVEIYPPDSLRLSRPNDPDKPKDFSVLEDGTWFRKYAEPSDSTRIWLKPRTEEFIEGYRGGWLIPKRDPLPTKSSNNRLLDPFTNTVASPEEPTYLSRWDAVTKFILDELDEGSNVYYRDVWSSAFTIEEHKPKELELEIGACLARILKIHPVRTDLEEFTVGIPTIQILYHELEKDDALGDIYELGITNNRIGLVNLRLKENDKDPIITNPYNRDPELIKNLIKLAIASFELEVKT